MKHLVFIFFLVPIFLVLSCAKDTTSMEEDKVQPAAIERLTFDLSSLKEFEEIPENCDTKSTETYLGDGFNRKVSFDYFVCTSGRYTKNIEFAAKADRIHSMILEASDSQPENWFILYMKSTKFLGSVPVGSYSSEVFNIKPNVSLDSFYSYVRTLPEHCELKETVGSEPRFGTSTQNAKSLPRIFEIINTDRKKVPARNQNMSKLEKEERRILASEVFKHNLSCGAPRKHIWVDDFLIYLIEDDILKLSTLKMFEK